MIIKLILIATVLLLFVWFMGNRTTTKMKATKKLAILLFFVLAVVSVLYPDITNSAAKLVGVGRGADLLLYATIVAFIAFVINQYAKSKEDEQKIVKLARKIAIIEANERYGKN